jgi:hypothetical protein
MSTTYQTADDDVRDTLTEVMRKYHPGLAAADVQVGILMASNPEGNAVTHGGYPAFAKIKVVSLKDRVSKHYDAELLIDESEWNRFRHEHRLALLDHELSHLTTVPLKEDEATAALADDPKAPTWKLDDLGRPKLKTVPGDWNGGDGFRDVVSRHGAFAIEYENLNRAKAAADAARMSEAA